MGTVVAVMGLQVLDIFAGRIDIQDTLPSIRSFILTDSNGIAIEIGSVDAQAEAVYTITAVLIGIMINIFAISIESIFLNDYSMLNMLPDKG